MESLYAQRSTAIAFAVCWVIAVLLVWLLHRQWWTLRPVRSALWIVPSLVLVSIVAWAVSVRAHSEAPTVVFAILSGFGVTAAVGLVVVLPFSGAVLTLERLVRWIARRMKRATSATSEAALAMARGVNAGSDGDAGTDEAVRVKAVGAFAGRDGFSGTEEAMRAMARGANAENDRVAGRDDSERAKASGAYAGRDEFAGTGETMRPMSRGANAESDDLAGRDEVSDTNANAVRNGITESDVRDANVAVAGGGAPDASNAIDGIDSRGVRDNGVRDKSAARISSRSHDRGRRSFIATAAAALPAFAIGASGTGVASSYGRTRFPNVPLAYANLPEALEGLRILHLSDVHLGYFVGLNDLEQTMIDAQAQRPDIVLVTGDLSDDLDVLPDALRMIAAIEPRFGTYASIGNHEYYRGIERVHRAFDAGPIPLLIDASTPITVGSARIHIAGADDPARVGRFNDAKFMRSTVEQAIDGMPSEAFSILMSHRPEGFDIAARHGVDLTLSGHYHGGVQLGLGGRAIIQPLRPNVYYWGHYRKGPSQLYTSGGVGHWFPFRLNCPPEAPVYVLGRA